MSSIKTHMIAWDPASDKYPNGRFRIGPWPDNIGWSDDYLCTGGACFTYIRKASKDNARLYLLSELFTIIDRDNVSFSHIKPHLYAHKMKEYLESLSKDEEY